MDDPTPRRSALLRSDLEAALEKCDVSRRTPSSNNSTAIGAAVVLLLMLLMGMGVVLTAVDRGMPRDGAGRTPFDATLEGEEPGQPEPVFACLVERLSPARVAESGVCDVSGCATVAGGQLPQGAFYRRLLTLLDHLPLEVRQSVQVIDLSHNRLTDVPWGVFYAPLGGGGVMEARQRGGGGEVDGDASSQETAGLRRVRGDDSRFPALTTLFLTGNRLTAVPPALASLQGVTRLSLKANLLKGTLFGSRLPPGLVHLILTENQLTRLGPLSLPHLRKLMLSGNELRTAFSFLRGEGAALPSLELLRLSRNRIEHLSSFDAEALESLPSLLPALRWISFAGNPFVKPSPRHLLGLGSAAAPVGMGGPQNQGQLPVLDPYVQCPANTSLGILGAGASGSVRQCTATIPKPSQRQGEPTEVAVKFFKSISSDGSAIDELWALAHVPQHPSLLRALGALWNRSAAGHDPAAGRGPLAAVYPLMRQPTPLAQPPTIETVTEDRFSETNLRAHGAPWMPTDVARRLVEAAGALATLHAAGVVHGDIYAHNVFVSTVADGSAAVGLARALVSDFGASFVLSPSSTKVAAVSHATRRALERVEVRAFAVLAGDLVQHYTLSDPEEESEQPQSAARSLRVFSQRCRGGVVPSANGGHVNETLWRTSASDPCASFDEAAQFLASVLKADHGRPAP